MLQARLFYGALMIIVSVSVVIADAYWAPFYPMFMILLSLVILQGGRELSRLMTQAGLPTKFWFCQVGCLLVLWANWISTSGVFGLRMDSAIGMGNLQVPFGVFVALGMISFLIAAWEFSVPGKSVAAVAGHVLSLFYLGLLSCFVVKLRGFGNDPALGATAFFLTVFTAKLCDAGAFFIGRKFGRTRIAPKLSPGKTLEGSIGGLITAVVLASAINLLGEWLSGKAILSPRDAMLFGLLVGLAAQTGDLMESMIKRDSHQKDSSTHIPGFGGVLDVIDSILFCGPVGFLLLCLL
jgi:phosphatidate cytidylyltransferase